jgi:AraC-like DNA-binding protein
MKYKCFPKTLHMKSQTLHLPLGSLLDKNPSESYVNIVLNAGHVNTILPFLITNEIPFTLSAAGEGVEKMDSEPKPIEKKESMLLNLAQSVISLPPRSGDKKKNILIDKIYQKYIVKGIEKIPPVSEEIAEEIGLSLSQFKALFKKRYGKPFYQMYVEHKMEYAAQLLREGYTSVVVSERIGYVHPIKFNKMFQKYYGVTPYQYQKSQK